MNSTSTPFEAGRALVLLFGITIFLAVLSVSPAGAEESTTGEATTLQVENDSEASENTEAVIQRQDVQVVAQTDDGSTSGAVDTNNASQETGQPETGGTSESDEEAQEDVSQPDTQRAKQPASQANSSLADRTAEVTESSDDPDEIVDRIVVPGADCDVAADAVVVVEDDDGTRVRLVNGENATISATDDQITISGTGAGGNLAGISPDGGNQQFGTNAETVTGTVISSTGIACGDDAAGGGNTGGGGTGGGGTNGNDGEKGPEDLSCVQVLRIFRNDQNEQYFSLDGELAQQIQVCLENEVIVGSDTEGPLPPTGGPPLLALAALGIASAALGASVVRAGLRREG